MPLHPEIREALSPLDAVERLCVEVVQFEAVATATETAMDKCPLPAAPSRRAFNRPHALVSSAVRKAAGAVELIEQLKTSLAACPPKR